MVKIQVICEKCGKIVEIKPRNNGNQSDLQSALQERNFVSYDTDIDAKIESDLETIKDMEDIEDEIEIKTHLNSFRVECRNCGSYIELTDIE